ncbi:hypothetical protein [Streptomyces sp. NPDC102437]|uniref:hypothetical protein n=1 Tax=Streptomyces sp. NPDC102437 TaxID=3366175 RepID=UPI0038151812
METQPPARAPFSSYLHPDLQAAFKARCALLGIEMRDALQAALEAWLSPASVAPRPDDDTTTARALARQAAQALNQHDPETARALADIAHVYTRLAQLHPTAPPRPPAPAPEPADLPQPRSAHPWDDPSLPDDCAPGLAPDLLTDAQSLARIRYGYEHGWSQRRVATFAGRSPATAHKRYAAFAAE